MDIDEQIAVFKDTLSAVKHRQIDPIEQYLLNEIVLLKSGKIIMIWYYAYNYPDCIVDHSSNKNGHL